MIEINENEIEETLLPLVLEIIKATKAVLEKTPPELAADIIDKGIVLTGGGALLNGLSKIFEDEVLNNFENNLLLLLNSSEDFNNKRIVA